MRQRWLIGLGIGAAVSVVACLGGGDGEDDEPERRESIRAADYDQSCNINEDCAQVIEGSLCSPCGCPNAGIARDALASYTAYANGRTCEVDSGPVCAACPPSQAICEAKKCDVAPVVTLGAAGYKTSCALKEDCVAIFQGEGCAACKCDNAAINKEDLAAYQAERDAVRCGATGVACAADCAQAEVDCVEGVCQVVQP